MILYLDTSTSFLYTALYYKGTVIDYISSNLGRDLSGNVLTYIEDMLKKNNVSLYEIKKIIAVNGPGSFTGIRVGLTIAKVLAWSMNIPIITISSLEAMALSVREDYDFCVPIIDARRNCYYVSIFDNKNKSFIMNEQYLNFDVINAAVDNLNGTVIYISNDEVKSITKTSKYNPNYKEIIEFVMDREPTDVHLVDANYLKKTEAEEKLNDN